MLQKIIMMIRILMNKILDFIKKYWLPILGLFIVIFFIWLRYLRTRLPKDLPFYYLSLKGFIILMIICCIYILIIKSLLKPSGKTNIFSEYIVPRMYLPLESFDVFIKESWDRERIFFYIIQKLTYYVKDTHLFYLCLAIIPRLILVSILFMDVFYFHKLAFIYYVLYLTILLFLNKYIIYSLKIFKKQLIVEAKNLLMDGCIDTAYIEGVHPDDDPHDPDYDPCLPSMSLPLEIFIDFQVRSIIYDNITRKYEFYFSKMYYEQLEKNIAKSFDNKLVTYDDYWDYVTEHKKMVIKPKIEKIIEIGSLIEYYKITHNTNERFKRIKTLIFTTYLICWTYILIISLPNMNLLHVIESLFEVSRLLENPFTEEIIGLPFKDVQDLIRQYKLKEALYKALEYTNNS